MYKVFINDKPVILSDQIPDYKSREGVLQYKFKGHSDLKRLIFRFDQDKSAKELIIINRNNFDLLYNAFISLFTPMAAAGGIVFHPDKGMLWILRHNRWDLPKGKIDSDESIEAAAIREVEEETGLKQIKITAPLGLTRHAYPEKDRFILKTSHWFLMEPTKPDHRLVPQKNEGIMLVEWADQETVNEKINDTYASLHGLVKEFIAKYTAWVLR